MITAAIEREGCISCGQCWESGPDFFEENAEDGWSQVAAKFRIAVKLIRAWPSRTLRSASRRRLKAIPRR